MIYLKFKNAQMECVEFNCYFEEVGEDLKSQIELLVEANVNEIEEVYSNPFLIEMEHQTYVFGGYELWEFYEVENGLVKIVCIK